MGIRALAAVVFQRPSPTLKTDSFVHLCESPPRAYLLDKLGRRRRHAPPQSPVTGLQFAVSSSFLSCVSSPIQALKYFEVRGVGVRNWKLRTANLRQVIRDPGGVQCQLYCATLVVHHTNENCLKRSNVWSLD